MIRMTLLLAFCIWLVFVLGPEPAPPGPQVVAETADPEAVTPEDGRSVTLETGEVWQIDRVIRSGPQQPDAEPVVAARAESAEDDTDDARAQEIANAEVLFLYVTGTRVNLRAGPSTDNPIVAALTQGTATELVAEAPDGWFEIRDPATGTTGFMSGDFLSPTPP